MNFDSSKRKVIYDQDSNTTIIFNNNTNNAPSRTEHHFVGQDDNNLGNYITNSYSAFDERPYFSNYLDKHYLHLDY